VTGIQAARLLPTRTKGLRQTVAIIETRVGEHDELVLLHHQGSPREIGLSLPFPARDPESGTGEIETLRVRSSEAPHVIPGSVDTIRVLP
jgi:hypothetical protein